MVKLFFGNRSFALLFLPAIIGLFYLCNHFFQHHAPDAVANFGFWGRLENQDYIVYEVIALALVFVNASVLNTLFNRNEFMEKNNYLSSLLYVSFISFFHSFYYLDGLSIAQTLIVLTLYQLIKLNQNEDGRRIVFNASVLFGLACAFYPVLLLGIPFLFWMVWVVRPFIFRESVLIITGFIFPLIYAAVYSYVFQTQLDRQEFSSSSSENHLLDMLVLGSGVVLLLIMCAKTVLNTIETSTIRLKKLFKIVLLLSALSIGLVALEFLIFRKSDVASLCLIPLMVFLPYSFGTKKQRVVPTLVFYLILFFSVGKFFIAFDNLTF